MAPHSNQQAPRTLSRGVARPSLHVTPPTGWLNDPHGVSYRDGLYHLFYQAIPQSMDWRPEICWGHATSSDLVTWSHRPVALEPAADEAGCWTGCLVAPPDSAPFILYTSVVTSGLDLGTVRVARPVDASWDRWVPAERVPLSHRGFDVAVFRDPQVRRDGDVWRMVMGAGLRDGRPVVLGWSSTDLCEWAFDGVVAIGDSGAQALELGSGWECPQVVHVDGEDVLIVGTWNDGVTGELLVSVASPAGGFAGAPWQQLSFGGGPYAATTFTDADGRACAMFWIRGVQSDNEGWAGVLSVPYVLSVHAGVVHVQPHPRVLEAFAQPAPGRAAFEWLPERPDDTAALLDLAGPAVASFSVDGGTLVVSAGDRVVALPCAPAGEPVRILVDGIVLEVSTAVAVAAVPLERPLESPILATTHAGPAGARGR